MNRLLLIDRAAFVITLALCATGIVFVRSATMVDDSHSVLWLKQIVWVCGGIVVYAFMSQYDYKKLISHGHIFYIIGIISLVLLLRYGVRLNGARSWFRLPFMSVQPSEFMKIATILMAVKFFSKYEDRQSSLWEFVVSTAIVGIPFVLITLQPDLGTAIVYLPFFVIPNFLIGKRESIYVTITGTLLAGLLVMGVLYKPGMVFFLKDYQKDRIVAFIYPERDTTNKGYQVHQSKISIGQGGLFGQGLGEGKQTKLGFLPAQYNDFILAVVAEESGFLGICLVFALFLALFLRCFQTALDAGDAMGSTVVVLAIGTLATQMLFNAAMLIGLVPTTGIPCPLISYGGSSMLTTMGLLGLVQSVRTHRFVNA